MNRIKSSLPSHLNGFPTNTATVTTNTAAYTAPSATNLPLLGAGKCSRITKYGTM